MNAFWDILEGVASEFVSSAFERTQVNAAGALVETCCQQLGWTIDERPNARQMVLYFHDPLIRRRNVRIGFGDKGLYATFTVFSAVSIPVQHVSLAVLGHLLEGNGKPFVSWRMFETKANEVGFGINYYAIAAGLRPEILKVICDTLIQEACEFDSRMDKAGLIR